jgi:uncharacterized protein (DUF2236 family)
LLRRLPPLLWLMQLPAIGLLPPQVREAYGLRWGRTEAVALAWFAAGVRLTLRLSPPVVRFWPAARSAESRGAAWQEWQAAALALRKRG